MSILSRMPFDRSGSSGAGSPSQELARALTVPKQAHAPLNIVVWPKGLSAL